MNCTIGILGGGQLCRMMGEAVRYNGLPFRLVALDPVPNCPAYDFIDEQIVADFKDEDAVIRFADSSDLITYEIELANGKALEALNRSGKQVHPSPATLRTIQDKYQQKSFLCSKGIPVPDFVSIEDSHDAELAARNFGYPFMVKARRDSYDGRGNFLVTCEGQIPEAMKHFSGRDLMAERYVDFVAEVSVIAARSVNGEICTYPVGENVHESNVLRTTIVPARIDSSVAGEAVSIAGETLQGLMRKGAGGNDIDITA